MDRITDRTLATVADGFAAQLKAAAPEWTNESDHDPGVTLVEVFAFLAEQLLYRPQPMPDRAQRALATATTALRALQSHSGASFDGLTRVHYFPGQLLTADDFHTDQDYHRAKLRRRTSALLGAGIVTGLDVTVDLSSTHDQPVVSIDAGLAIAPDGEELAIPSPRVCRLSATAPVGFVTLAYAERFAQPAPTTIETAQPSRIQEGVRVLFTEQLSADGIQIAKLERHHGDWRIAADFRAPKAGRA